MNINFYEILNQISNSPSKEEKQSILLQYASPLLKQFLSLAFHPDIRFYPSSFPEGYKEPDTLPGISFSTLPCELKRLYLFQIGNETADSLTIEKRNNLLLQLLESLEPAEAQTLINLFNKDLKTKGLTYSLVKETFPNLLP
jgi:hypothetical protein